MEPKVTQICTNGPPETDPENKEENIATKTPSRMQWWGPRLDLRPSRMQWWGPRLGFQVIWIYIDIYILAPYWPFWVAIQSPL